MALVLAALGCSDNDGNSDPDAAGGFGGDSGGSGGASGAAAGGGMGGSGSNGMVGGASGGDGSEGCGPVLREPRCLGEWCWDGPGLVGGDLFAIDGTRDAESVWAVGSLGTALRYCGGQWLPIDTGVPDHLYDVFSPTNDFAVAVGANGTVIKWDGHAWTRVDMPTEHPLRAVWGASPSDVWIGADIFIDYEADNLFRFDGTAITETAATRTSYRGMRGRSSNDIYAFGDHDWWSSVDHFDGTEWTEQMISVDPGVGSIGQLVFGPTKNRTFVLYDETQVIADDRPGWITAYRSQDLLSGLHLNDDHAPSVVSSNASDPLMPGVVLTMGADLEWTMTPERFAISPNEVWTGAGQGFAVGLGSSLVARGDDDVWDQVPGFDAQLGMPFFLSGTALDDGYMVTDSDIYHRDANGWQLVEHGAPFSIQSAALDPSGNLYVQQAGATGRVIRYYDGSAWHDVALEEGHYGQKLFAFAPDDIWLIDSSGSHFDGSSWTYVYDMCDAGIGGDVQRVRRAPDGSIWAVTETAAVQFAWPSLACMHVNLADGDRALTSTDPLVDIAWTDNGEMFVISHFGRLFRRDGEVFVTEGTPAVDVIPGPSTDTSKLPYVPELFAVPGAKLRYLLTIDHSFGGSQSHMSTSQLITVDATNTSAEPTIEELPVLGPLWPIDDTRTLIAFQGGVLSRGVEHAPVEIAVGSPGGTEDGITTNPVPYEQIFCEPADVTGQTLIVPCTTAIELSHSWGKPTPGGSMCNGYFIYTLSLITNELTWSKCLEGPMPTDPWTHEGGSKQLTEDELAAVVESLKVMTLSSATECAGMDDVPLKNLWVITRTDSSKYTDSHYGCYVDEVFVDHIDEALDLLDSMAR